MSRVSHNYGARIHFGNRIIEHMFSICVKTPPERTIFWKKGKIILEMANDDVQCPFPTFFSQGDSSTGTSTCIFDSFQPKIIVARKNMKSDTITNWRQRLLTNYCCLAVALYIFPDKIGTRNAISESKKWAPAKRGKRQGLEIQKWGETHPKSRVLWLSKKSTLGFLILTFAIRATRG